MGLIFACFSNGSKFNFCKRKQFKKYVHIHGIKFRSGLVRMLLFGATGLKSYKAGSLVYKGTNNLVPSVRARRRGHWEGVWKTNEILHQFIFFTIFQEGLNTCFPA